MRAEEYPRSRKPAKQPKKDANMEITRTSGKRVSASQRDLATVTSNPAAVLRLLKKPCDYRIWPASEYPGIGAGTV
jgi:hypothetical protein